MANGSFIIGTTWRITTLLNELACVCVGVGVGVGVGVLNKELKTHFFIHIIAVYTK